MFFTYCKKGVKKLNILFEYMIVFVSVWIIHYFMFVKNKKKYDKKKIPTELLYLQKIYHINPKSINYQKFIYAYSFINTFIISTIYIILMYLLNNWVLRVILGIVLLILMIIICYGILGRYYLKKEGNKNV